MKIIFTKKKKKLSELNEATLVEAFNVEKRHKATE